MSCHREDELLDALRRGFIGAELDEHIATCPSCAELRAVAGALLDDRAEAIASAEVPTPGAMLWRIRVRARREAEARARRSLLFGHAATLAAAIALVIVFFGDALGPAVRQLFQPLTAHLPFVIAAAICLLIAPFGGWMVVRR